MINYLGYKETATKGDNLCPAVFVYYDEEGLYSPPPHEYPPTQTTSLVMLSIVYRISDICDFS